MDANGDPLGVQLKYFPKFIKKYNIQYSLTTTQVCDSLIKKVTKDGDLCFWDLIPKEFRGKAEAFVSHAWKQPFRRITDLLLKGRVAGKSNSKMYVWFDLFSVHQNGGQKQKDDLDSIGEVIKKCGKTVLLIDHQRFDKPPVLFTRMWCLYEIYRTQNCGGKFVLVFDEPFLGLGEFETLKIEDGEITKDADRAMIMEDIGENKVKVNELLNQVLHEVWVTRSLALVIVLWFNVWALLVSAMVCLLPLIAYQ